MITAYIIGACLMLALCGFAIGKEISATKLLGCIIVAAFWPIVLPVMIGGIIRELCS